MRKHGRKVLVLSVIVAAMVLGAAQAEATWWRVCPPVVGCGPCYTSCYTPCYTPCTWSCASPCTVSSCDPCGDWCLGVRPGPVRRLLFGPYRWYYNYNCGYACCDWSRTGCDACQPAAGQPGTVAPEGPTRAPANPENAPVNPVPPAAAPAVPPVMTPPVAPPAGGLLPNKTTSVIESRGLLNIWVPAKTKVFINGMETKSSGSERQYVSYGLKPGLVYKYEVRVELIRNGHTAEETQTVYLRAGGEEGLAFGFNRQPLESVASAQ